MPGWVGVGSARTPAAVDSWAAHLSGLAAGPGGWAARWACRALSCSRSLLITLSCWVLALLARFADDDYWRAVMADYQRVVAASRMTAVFAAVMLAADWLPADCPLSWSGHDGSRIAITFDGLRSRRANRGRNASRRHASQLVVVRRSYTVVVTAFSSLWRSPQTSQRSKLARLTRFAPSRNQRHRISPSAWRCSRVVRVRRPSTTTCPRARRRFAGFARLAEECAC